MTSDERRDVAARLRENAEKRGVTLDYLGSTQVNSWWLLLNSIGCDSNHQEVAFNLIADLIDPTCHVVIPNEMDGECFCSECGALLGEYGYTAYCPNCGARCVDNGGRHAGDD